MKPYYQDDLVTIIHGNCREIPLKGISAVVTDPPYELGFMGKSWDSKGISFQKDTWQLILEACLPGAMLLSFGGTRTSHRIACAIEDAGWEIRDTIMWVYGSGFPKSLDISKAIDKQKGAKREVVGEYSGAVQNKNSVAGGFNASPNADADGRTKVKITIPTSTEAKLWEGYGTALKPAYENIIVAQSPLTAVPFYDIMMVVMIQIGEQICQLPSFARIAGSHSASNSHELNEELDIAQWLVGNSTNTLGILPVLTDTVRLESATNTNWNIVLLWLNILTDLYKIASRFTISTETALITELKILQSLAWQGIFQNIIHLKDNQTNGLSADALTAVNLFNAIVVKLNYILTHSAQDTAIFKDAFSDLRLNYEPIILAMKPLDGTFANNALKHKVAGLNIDGCRIPLNGDMPKAGNRTATFGTQETVSGGDGSGGWESNKQGRFPADFIHDGSQEVMELFPNTKTGWSNKDIVKTKGKNPIYYGGATEGQTGNHYPDNEGSAARFFYCAKASRSERDAGLEDMPEVLTPTMEMRKTPHLRLSDNPAYNKGTIIEPPVKRNPHPTVKPLSLMTYLCKLVKMPEYNLILDPFCGSGSTLLACKNLGIKAIGIDSSEEYCEITAKRLR